MHCELHNHSSEDLESSACRRKALYLSQDPFFYCCGCINLLQELLAKLLRRGL